MNSLPVYYKKQNKPWINAQLFMQCFYQQFVPAVKIYSEKNVLPVEAWLVIDNAQSHHREMCIRDSPCTDLWV